MTMMKKLATLAALAALAAPAFAAVDPAAYTDGDTVQGLADAEFTTPALSVDGNYAQIFQESGANVGYVNQTGANNFASIVQGVNDANQGVIFQTGDANLAAIRQH